ncbi:MAG: protease modulator HflC [Pseudomonadota bacterium]
MNKTTLGIVAAVVLLFVLVIDETSALFVIDEREQAIVTQLGEYRRTVVAPGLYFKTPFVQTVHRMERRILGRDTPADDYLTLDKKKLVADPVTRWKIVDPKLFFITVRDEVRAQKRLDDIVRSELRDEISGNNFGEIIGNARQPLMDAVTSRVRTKLTEFGIEVLDVRIKRADLPQQVTESVFQRMRAERDRVAKRYLSEGEEEAAKIRAEAEKEVTIELAKAYEKAQRLRGEGDATSTQIYADAFGKDAEFYAFLRSLEAYEKSIAADTELVMSSGSDLFKYLDSPSPSR